MEETSAKKAFNDFAIQALGFKIYKEDEDEQN